MPGPIFLEGEAVELRTIEEEDAEFLQRTINDPAVRRGLRAVEPIGRHQELEWIDSVGDDGDAILLVCVDGSPVGTVGFEPPNEAWGTAEIGYMIAPDEQGNGYATDAVGLLCGYAFEERRLNKVYAGVYATNPASGRVLEKVGFEREGTLRQEAFVDGEHVDVIRYGLLASEWE